MRGRLRLALLLVATGCGRIGFDALDSAGDGGAGAPDAPRLGPCPLAAQADDPVALTGRTIRYVDFLGTAMPVTAATVIARTPAGDLLGAATSDNTGAYTLALPTGGLPVTPVLTITHPGDATTTLVLDTPLARATTLDLEVTAPGALDAVYFQRSLPRMSGRGTLLVLAQDCAGARLAGVTISAVPAPAAISYYADDGEPTAPSTSTTYARAIGYNAPPGTTRVTAALPGRSFVPADIEVVAGDQQSIVIVHPVD